MNPKINSSVHLLGLFILISLMACYAEAVIFSGRAYDTDMTSMEILLTEAPPQIWRPQQIITDSGQELTATDKGKTGADYGVSLALSKPAWAFFPKFSLPSLSSLLPEFQTTTEKPEGVGNPGPYGLYWSDYVQSVLKSANLTTSNRFGDKTDAVEQSVSVQLGSRLAVAMAVLFAPFLGLLPIFPVFPSVVSLLTVFGFLIFPGSFGLARRSDSIFSGWFGSREDSGNAGVTTTNTEDQNNFDYSALEAPAYYADDYVDNAFQQADGSNGKGGNRAARRRNRNRRQNGFNQDYAATARSSSFKWTDLMSTAISTFEQWLTKLGTEERQRSN